MTTSFTHDVADGRLTDFKTFAMRCARGMGFLICLDDHIDAPFPTQLEPNRHNLDSLAKARNRLAELEAMDLYTAKEKAAEDYKQQIQYQQEYIEAKEAKRRNYQAMLEKAKAWKPDYILDGMKKFIFSQLKDSMQWDCGTFIRPVKGPETGEEWLANKKAESIRDIAYHTNAWAEEQARTEERNLHLRKLRESLE